MTTEEWRGFADLLEAHTQALARLLSESRKWQRGGPLTEESDYSKAGKKADETYKSLEGFKRSHPDAPFP